MRFRIDRERAGVESSGSNEAETGWSASEGLDDREGMEVSEEAAKLKGRRGTGVWTPSLSGPDMLMNSERLIMCSKGQEAS